MVDRKIRARLGDGSGDQIVLVKCGDGEGTRLAVKVLDEVGGKRVVGEDAESGWFHGRGRMGMGRAAATLEH